MKFLLAVVSLAFLAQLTGCSTVGTAIEKRNLEVESKMSDTVFLEPVSASDKTVYIDFRSTADKPINLERVKQNMAFGLKNKGYTVVQDLSQANFLIQGNILSATETNEHNPFSAIQAGFGGAATGATIGALVGSSWRGAGVGGLIGGAAGVVGNALVKDIYYSMVADVRIKQRLPEGQTVSFTQEAKAKSGSDSSAVQVRNGVTEWLTYNTRIVSVANQVNLDYEDAQPELENGLVVTTVGIF